MYPYQPYNSNNQNEENQGASGSYYPPLVSQQREPDQNGYYHFSPGGTPDNESKKPKKDRSRAARMVAGAAAVLVMSAAAGGGTAMYVLKNNSVAPEPDQSSTVLQTSVADKVTAEAGSVASVAEKASASVVEIDTKSRQANFFMGTTLVPGAGSGVIISQDGYIVTNNHVVEDTESIVVRLNDGTEYDAKLMGTDSQSDLAVIKIEATGLRAATFADSDQIQVGDLAVAIGNPLGELGGTVTSGIISATGREVTIENENMTLLQTSAAINPGNSGGGLFDSNGDLIGVVNAKSAGVEIEGLGFAIPSNTAKKVAADIIDKGYVTGRTQMGIQVVDVQDSQTAMMVGVSKAGVYVTDPGKNEGLKEGDRFVTIDDQIINGQSDITNVLKQRQVGDMLEVTVERGGKAVATQVTLEEKTPEPQAAESADGQTP